MNRKGALRIALAAACLLFTLSIVYPFLQTEENMTDLGPIQAYLITHTYWSFKAIYVLYITTDLQIVTQPWFQDYWGGYATHGPADKPVEPGIGMAAVLILMFVAQSSTLLSAALAISKVKPYMVLSAALLSLFTTLCMWLFSRAVTNLNIESTFQAGFWLTLPAAALFLGTFLIGKADSRLSPFSSKTPPQLNTYTYLRMFDSAQSSNKPRKGNLVLFSSLANAPVHVSNR